MKIPSEEWFTTKKIVCCNVCEGSGIRECSELTCYHRGDYDYWKEYCSFCEGQGRVIEYTYSTRLDIILPNNKLEYKSIEYKNQSPLKHLTTADIYKIGR
jgi:hypothetical protein